MLRLRNPFSVPSSPQESKYHYHSPIDSKHKVWRVPSSPRGSRMLGFGTDSQSSLIWNAWKWHRRIMLGLLTCLTCVLLVLLTFGGPLGTSWMPVSTHKWQKSVLGGPFSFRAKSSTAERITISLGHDPTIVLDRPGQSNERQERKFQLFGARGNHYRFSEETMLKQDNKEEAVKEATPKQLAVTFPQVAVRIPGGDLSDAKYLSEHSDISGSAWESLLPRSGGFISLDNGKHEVALAKQLKCLVKIRGALLGRGEAFPGQKDETWQCLDYLRQVVICHGDMTLEVVNEEGPAGKMVDSAGVHLCKDWDSVKKWIENNTVHS